MFFSLPDLKGELIFKELRKRLTWQFVQVHGCIIPINLEIESANITSIFQHDSVRQTWIYASDLKNAVETQKGTRCFSHFLFYGLQMSLVSRTGTSLYETLENPMIPAITDSQCVQAWASISCWQLHPHFMQFPPIFSFFLGKITPPPFEKHEGCQATGAREASKQKWGISSCCPSGPCTDARLRRAHSQTHTL